MPVFRYCQIIILTPVHGASGGNMVNRIHFVFLNIGHFFDHLFMLIFATVTALTLSQEWGISYAELIPYATPGFVAFGVCSVPAGWLADKWSRKGVILYRNRPELNLHGAFGITIPDRNRPFCRHLSPGRTCACRAGPQGHRFPARP